MQLNPGQTFGEMKDQTGPVKSSYPTYTTTEPCMLMRITAFNYEKVVEVSSCIYNRMGTQHALLYCACFLLLLFVSSEL